LVIEEEEIFAEADDEENEDDEEDEATAGAPFCSKTGSGAALSVAEAASLFINLLSSRGEVTSMSFVSLSSAS
jgi:hypothetical protein